MSDWTIKAALEWTCGYLAEKGDENPRLSAQWLLSEACDLTRTQLFVNYDRPLSEEERAALRDYVRRRGAGEPLQYITGEVAFRHINVKVRPGVLIPRPETEVLVSEVLAALPGPRRREARWNEEAAEREREAIEAVRRALEEVEETAGGNRRSFDSGIATSARDDTGKGAGSQEGGLKPAPTENAVGADADPGAPFGIDPVGGDFSRPLSASIDDANAVAETASEHRGESRSAPAEDADAGDQARPLLVADLCTGSGCIACSLAFEHPDVRVIATDIALEAVALARENARALGLSERVAVLECSLGSGIGEKRMGTFDAVVSNPPYVPTAVMANLPCEVADHEPSLALDGGDDGLDLFRPLIAWAARALKPGGLLACELFEGHLDTAAALARDAGFADVRIVSDLADRPRVLLARKPQ